MKKNILQQISLAYLNEEKKAEENKKIEKEKKEKERSKHEKASYDAFNKLEESKKKKMKFVNFKKSAKKSLVSEAILVLYNNSFYKNKPLIENEALIRKGLVNKFITENGGTEEILNSMIGKSFVLSEMYNVINKYYNIISEKVDETKETNIDPALKDNFYDDIINIPELDDVCISIKQRVASAMENFKDKNMSDKMDIENISQICKEKMVNAKTAKIKEQYEMDANREIAKIKQRKRNILESMILETAKKSFTDKSLKEKFNKDNHIDYDSIVENCEVLYTFLETLNTSKLMDVDEKYLTEFIK